MCAFFCVISPSPRTPRTGRRRQDSGLLFSFYMLSGYGQHAQGVELDAIAAVVIGGTVLTGGYG